MPMFATYRAKVERIILFVKIANRYFERKECFLAVALCSSMRIKGTKLGECFVHATVTNVVN